MKTPHPSLRLSNPFCLTLPLCPIRELEFFWGGVGSYKCNARQASTFKRPNSQPNGGRRETDCLSKNETFHVLHPPASVSALFASLAITIFTELNCLASPDMTSNKRKRKGTTDKNKDDVDDGRRGLILLSQEEVERWRGKEPYS